MSKVVKDLPANPIDFIISKLQISQRQRKKVRLFPAGSIDLYSTWVRARARGSRVEI